MRLRFRAGFLVGSSLLVAIACVGGGGGDQCLNPIPDLPSCRGAADPGPVGGAFNNTPGGAPSSFAGASTGAPSVGGAPGMQAGGSGNGVGEAGASWSSDDAGAGGDTGIESGGGAGGAAGSAGDGP